MIQDSRIGILGFILFFNFTCTNVIICKHASKHYANNQNPFSWYTIELHGMQGMNGGRRCTRNQSCQ